MFQMHPDKAPGPDGMIPAFFQRYWHIVGDGFYRVTKHFFCTWEISQGLNDTNIIVIPKKKNPVVVGDLRPNSLCNVFIIIITKIIDNMIKGLLDSVVLDTQGVFVPGGLISDNIMVAY